MEVILLEGIDNLGKLGDIVSVRSGYARNFLVPQKKASIATKANLAEFEGIRAELEAAAATVKGEAETRRDAISGTTVHIQANAGAEGKLFGSVSAIAIAKAVAASGVPLETNEIRMPEGPLHFVGEHTVDVHLYADVDTTITVIVEADAESATQASFFKKDEEEKDDSEENNYGYGYE